MCDVNKVLHNRYMIGSNNVSLQYVCIQKAILTIFKFSSEFTFDYYCLDMLTGSLNMYVFMTIIV